MPETKRAKLLDQLSELSQALAFDHRSSVVRYLGEQATKHELADQRDEALVLRVMASNIASQLDIRPDRDAGIATPVHAIINEMAIGSAAPICARSSARPQGASRLGASGRRQYGSAASVSAGKTKPWRAISTATRAASATMPSAPRNCARPMTSSGARPMPRRSTRSDARIASIPCFMRLDINSLN